MSILSKENKKKIYQFPFTIYAGNDDNKGGLATGLDVYKVHQWWSDVLFLKCRPMNIGKFVETIYTKPSKLLSKASYITIDVKQIYWSKNIDVIVRYMGIRELTNVAMSYPAYTIYARVENATEEQVRNILKLSTHIKDEFLK